MCITKQEKQLSSIHTRRCPIAQQYPQMQQSYDKNVPSKFDQIEIIAVVTFLSKRTKVIFGRFQIALC